MLDQLSQFVNEHLLYLTKDILRIMSEVYDLLTMAATSLTGPFRSQKKSGVNHVTFVERSFSQALGRGSSEQSAAKLELMRQSNKRTISFYVFLTIVSYLAHFSFVLWPKVQLESFSVLEPEGWQFVTINLVPAFVQFVAVYAMVDFNRPLPDGCKLSAKHSALELDQNEFIRSLKLVVYSTAFAQMASFYSDLLPWSVVVLLPLWCFQLTTRLARSEFDRHAPSPKKSWRLSSTPSTPVTPVTPNKSAKLNSAKKEAAETKATPRTRTRRAVKSFINNATDKYHQIEQTVAQQISTLQNNISSPLRRENKMIEYST